MGRKLPETAMMSIKFAGFSVFSSLAPNHLINEDNIYLVVVSKSCGSASGFENHGIYWSRATNYGSALIEDKPWKSSYAVEEL